MKLEVTFDTDYIDGYDFGIWLLSKIKLSVLSKVNVARLSKWKDYIESTYDNDRISALKSVDVGTILKQGIKNIIFKCDVNKLTFFIPNTIYVVGYNQLRLDTICKLINYGTISIQGCSIFTDTFEEFATNIESYTAAYLNETGVM